MSYCCRVDTDRCSLGFKFAFLRTRQVRWDLSSQLVNGKKYHDCFLPFNPIIIITCCGVHNQRKGNTAYHILSLVYIVMEVHVNAFFFLEKKIYI